MAADQTLSRGQLWTVVGAFLCLQALSILLFRQSAETSSLPFCLAAPGLAALAAWQSSRRRPAHTKRQFYLVITGFGLWVFAYSYAVWEELVLKAQVDSGIGSQIVFFLYGAPMLLALFHGGAEASTKLLTFDAVQVTLLGGLVYMVVFDVVPFAQNGGSDVSMHTLVLTFDLQALVLAVASLLRYLGTAFDEVSRENRRFYRTLTIFLVTRCVCVCWNNSLSGEDGFNDLLDTIPFLTFAACLLDPRAEQASPVRHGRFRSLPLLLDYGMPVILPAAVVAMGTIITRTHRVAGAVCLTIEMVAYGFRSTLVQLELERAQAEAKASRDALETLSFTDALTAVPNRRRFDQVLQHELGRVTRGHGPLALLIIDIDFFKRLNDVFGHTEGDISLRQVAHALQAALRNENDLLARLGGEEFAAVLPGTTAEGADQVALRMHTIVRGLKLRNRTPMGDTVTVSIGVAVAELPRLDSASSLIQSADRALYRAKEGGRNRTEVSARRSAEISATTAARLLPSSEVSACASG